MIDIIQTVNSVKSPDINNQQNYSKTNNALILENNNLVDNVGAKSSNGFTNETIDPMDTQIPLSNPQPT